MVVPPVMPATLRDNIKIYKNNHMKTKTILMVIAAAAIVSLGATRITNKKSNIEVSSSNVAKGSIGGFAADDKK